MTKQETNLKERLSSKAPILIAELTPPQSGDPEPVRAAARELKDKVHAVGLSDNRSGVCMSALAASSLVVKEGVEPILHMVTRDRNRIALLSDCLGAHALGVHNLLLTTGGHQTLGPFRASKNVFDLDSVQLIDAFCHLEKSAPVFGESGFDGVDSLCIGAVASPDADPRELQLMKLAKKIEAGASFLVTQPVYDASRFGEWWQEVEARGLHEKAAFVAGIHPLTDAASLEECKSGRRSARAPAALFERLSAQSDSGALREEGIRVAVELIEGLKPLGLRGFEIRVGPDPRVALEIIERASLRKE